MADKQPITTNEGASESVPGSFDAFARLRSSRWLSPICAVLALLPIIAFLCLIGFPKYAMTPDDQAQALYASGRIFGFGPTSLMLYTLYPVSAPLSMLYQTMPNVP